MPSGVAWYDSARMRVLTATDAALNRASGRKLAVWRAGNRSRAHARAASGPSVRAMPEDAEGSPDAGNRQPDQHRRTAHPDQLEGDEGCHREREDADGDADRDSLLEPQSIGHPRGESVADGRDERSHAPTAIGFFAF